MPISVTWGTKVINVPQNYLSFVSGTLWELDTNQFRLDLKDLEDDEEGMPFLDTHRHNTEVAVAGVTYARFFEIINGYQVEFEDLGHPGYTVRLVGSNNNIFEDGVIITNHNSVIGQNSAGLITVVSGSGVTEQDKDDIADKVLRELITDHDSIAGSLADYMSHSKKVIDNKKILDKTGATWHLIIYDDNGSTEIVNKVLKDLNGNDISDLDAGALAQELASSV